MNTIIKKNYYGKWEAKSTKPLTINNREAQLNITTSVSTYGKLITTASVGWVNNNSVSHTVYEDFYTNLSVSTHKRVTSKVVAEQHSSVASNIDNIVQEVAKYYEDKELIND
jgi:hypothetical protein